jgi:hypothetical protein
MSLFPAAAIEEASRIAAVQPPALFDHQDRIAALVRRMRYMMPGASSAPDLVIWRAAQLCAIHDLDPFGTGDIYIWSNYGEDCQDPKKWIVHVGIAAWRRKAQSQAKYTTDWRIMDAPEVLAVRGDELWHTADVGVELTLWRLDVARECKALGIPYQPVVGVGIWRKKAFKRNDAIWGEDSLANTETKEEKARKRAEMKALRIAFSLNMPIDDDPPADDDWAIIEGLEQSVTTEERLRQPVYQPPLNYEPTGDVLWA